MGRALAGSTIAEKLALNSVRDGECLRWTGAHTPKGYGQLTVDGRRVGVHRLAFEVAHGEIPAEHEVDHVQGAGCRWRDCIEPAHLEAVTHAENVRRVIERITHCARGHEFTPDNVKIARRMQNGRVYVCRQCKTCRRDDRRAARARRRAQSTVA